MTWTVEQVALLERSAGYGGLHVVGEVATRECGCRARRGMRLDLDEPTFSTIHCPDHEQEVERAMFVFGHMPPSPRPVFDLFFDLLEAEIRGDGP